jgi:hypothetical protein
MIRLLATGVLALVLPQAVHAQQGKPVATPQAQAAADPAAAMFKAWDKNSDGQLSLMEFRAGWQQAQAVVKTQAALGRQFAALDANHDRAIDAGEYGNLVLVKNAGKAAPPLARFDANANGKLEFAEYVKLVETLAPQEEARKGTKQ